MSVDSQASQLVEVPFMGQRELLARIPQPALELEGETGGGR